MDRYYFARVVATGELNLSKEKWIALLVPLINHSYFIIGKRINWVYRAASESMKLNANYRELGINRIYPGENGLHKFYIDMTIRIIFNNIYCTVKLKYEIDIEIFLIIIAFVWNNFNSIDCDLMNPFCSMYSMDSSFKIKLVLLCNLEWF